MNTVIAALDSSAADRPVIETALGLAELLGASVKAVHVGAGAAATAKGVAAMAEVALHLLAGPVVTTLLAELDEPDVVAGVLGARRIPMGRRPAGGTVLQVLEQTAKPVVVVPPEAFGVGPRPLRRLLVPLNGTELTSARIAEELDALVAADTELVVLHVFDEGATNPMVNHCDIEFERWGEEFLLRHLPGRQARFEWRSGYTPDLVVDVGEEHAVDLVVVSWAQTLEGHGDVIRALLSRSKVPVLVLPAGPIAVTGASCATTASRTLSSRQPGPDV
jgi:nucleotide-binding universal stress UspA family protein